METQAVNQRPLVISPIEDDEFNTGEVYTCYSHKAVKSAMNLIDSLYPNARYQMHGIGPFELFSLIELTRSDCIKLMNKIIIASDNHGYINKDSNKILKVEIEVKECNYRKERARVTIRMGTKKLDEEE